jgi:hypothetical protein
MTPNKPKKPQVRGKAGMSREKALFSLLIANTCKIHGLKLEAEYKFAENRKFRADFAIPELKALYEYEGIISGKARHTTVTGYTNDTIKYNLAASLGYRVFRYTALNFGQVEQDIIKLKNQSI